VRRFTQQTSHFAATKAQMQYLRAIHQGLPIRTNGATRARCWQFLVFEDGKVSIRPEIVKALNLDARRAQEAQ
jgi:hypothetical protein